MTLSEAILDNNIEKVSELLGEGASPDEDNGRPLILASHYGLEPIVELLLQYGADPNLPKNHTNAFIQSILQNNYSIAMKLLKKGIDNDIINIDNGALLMFSIKMENMQMIKLLIDAGIIINDQIITFVIHKKNKLPQLYMYLKNNYFEKVTDIEQPLKKIEKLSDMKFKYLIKKAESIIYDNEQFSNIQTLDELLGLHW